MTVKACTLRTFDNDQARIKCRMCETVLPDAVPRVEEAAALGIAAAAGSWACGVCTLNNSLEDRVCVVCHAPKPGASDVEPVDARAVVGIGGGGGGGGGGESVDARAGVDGGEGAAAAPAGAGAPHRVELTVHHQRANEMIGQAYKKNTGM